MSRVKLKDITTKIGSGATPTGGKSAYADDGISLIRSLNVHDFAFAFDNLAHITELQAKKLSNVEVFSGDILLNITGASVGRCCVVPEDALPARVNQHVSIIRIEPKRANFYYVLYYINSPYNKLRLLNIAQGGATREALTKETIENFEIELPPIENQTTIADILSRYDNLIENNNRRISILEEMAQRLYREWFVYFRFPRYENVEMVDSELGIIPEGWRVSDLESCCSIIRRGISPKYNDNATGTVINQKCIRDFLVNLQVARRQEKAFSNELQVQCGDVLINSTGVGTLGRVAQMYEFVPNCTIDSHVTLLRPNESIAYYVGSYLREKQDAIMDMGVGSTGQTELNRDKIKGLQLAIPDEETVRKYERYIDELMLLKIKLQKKNMTLRKTRDHLLPHLISGDIDVSKIEL